MNSKILPTKMERHKRFGTVPPILRNRKNAPNNPKTVWGIYHFAMNKYKIIN